MSWFLAVAAAGVYLACGIWIMGELRSPQARIASVVRCLAAAGLVLQGASLWMVVFGTGVIRFGPGIASSAVLFIAVAVILVESLVHRITALMGLVLLAGGVTAALPTVIPGMPVAVEEWSYIFRAHLFLALAACSFMLIAVMQAILFLLMDRQMQGAGLGAAGIDTGLLSNMPSLMAMDRILYRIVGCGFACLTAVLVLGGLTNLQVRGTWISFDHMTVLTWLSWIVFLLLLLGRRFLGWGKKRSLALFWAGVALLAVSYFVYRFIVDLFLW